MSSAFSKWCPYHPGQLVKSISLTQVMENWLNILENFSVSFHYENKKGMEQGYLLINIILITCAISILKAGSLYSSGANVILRLLLEGQINISVKYELFNDKKLQVGRTTHAPEQRLLAVNNSPLSQLSLQSNHSGPETLERILTGHTISLTQLS